MKNKIVGLIVILVAGVSGVFYPDILNFVDANTKELQVFNSNISQSNISIDEIPNYDGNIYITINNNIPNFNEEDKKNDAFELYSDLDNLNRAHTAFAKIDKSMMPTGERGSIGSVKPSGWHTIKYDIVNGKYLYNRSHLIGFQLTGENANENNLITGTRSFNVDGMLPFENMVADYINETNNSVMYRVTPIYDGNNLVATGVQIEAESIEDDGILFNVFVYNVQDGVEIDYSDGSSKLK